MPALIRTVNIRVAALLCGTMLVLTACSTDSAAEDIDRNTAVAQCGILGRIIGGDVRITVENVGEVKETLAGLASDGVGAVKSTAQHILDGIDGKEMLEADDTEAINDFKDFCKDYTVD